MILKTRQKLSVSRNGSYHGYCQTRRWLCFGTGPLSRYFLVPSLHNNNHIMHHWCKHAKRLGADEILRIQKMWISLQPTYKFHMPSWHSKSIEGHPLQAYSPGPRALFVMPLPRQQNKITTLDITGSKSAAQKYN